MDLEEVRNYCLSLPFVTEDIKWQHLLTFCVKDKMFALFSLDEDPIPICFKTNPENFDELLQIDGFKPAPYLGRSKWIQMDHLERLSEEKLKNYLYESYQIIKSKIPKNKFT